MEPKFRDTFQGELMEGQYQAMERQAVALERIADALELLAKCINGDHKLKIENVCLSD